MHTTDWRLTNEEPTDVNDSRRCPLCGARLDYLDQCPNWRDHAYDEYGLEP